GNGCADALYQHPDYEYYLRDDHGNGCNDLGLANGCNGRLDSERGDHHGHTFGGGDVYLHDHDDGWLYGWRKHDHGYDYGIAQ
ncbi:MAG: hypothetical protein EBR29_08675, partial [Sphingobacteriia bacterium]|nr:hypothetical protein [Sphingobacteriia bacterium]